MLVPHLNARFAARTAAKLRDRKEAAQAMCHRSIPFGRHRWGWPVFIYYPDGPSRNDNLQTLRAEPRYREEMDLMPKQIGLASIVGFFGFLAAANAQVSSPSTPGAPFDGTY